MTAGCTHQPHHAHHKGPEQLAAAANLLDRWRRQRTAVTAVKVQLVRLLLAGGGGLLLHADAVAGRPAADGLILLSAQRSLKPTQPSP